MPKIKWTLFIQDFIPLLETLKQFTSQRIVTNFSHRVRLTFIFQSEQIYIFFFITLQGFFFLYHFLNPDKKVNGYHPRKELNIPSRLSIVLTAQLIYQNFVNNLN